MHAHGFSHEVAKPAVHNGFFPKITPKRGYVNPIKDTINGGEMSKLLHHLDFTTGYHAIHRIDTFSRGLVHHYGKLLPYGGSVPFISGQFKVHIDGPRFTMFHKDFPFHEGGIGIGRDLTWIELHGIIKSLDWTLEAKPRPGLWLGEVPLPYMYELRREQIYWVFDFLRHLAAAMIASHSNRPV